MAFEEPKYQRRESDMMSNRPQISQQSAIETRRQNSITNRTAFLIRRLVNDQVLADLKKAKGQVTALRTQAKQHKQGHLTCLNEIIKLY